MSTSSLRVAQVCPYSWSVPGGVQSHVAGLARALRDAGVEVDVLAPADRPTDEVTALGRSIPIPDNGSVQRVALSPAAAARTFSLVRGGGYDVVHLHEPMIPFTCLTALLGSRVPLVGTFHMYASSLRWYRIFGPLCRAGLARLAVRVAVSPAARDYVAEACPGDYRVVPNGVDLDDTVAREPTAEPTVVFIGRPEPRKGLPVLLQAFRRLPPSVRLELVGVSAQEAGVEAGGRVTAHGRLSDEERTAVLRRADVLCAPSLGAESFGLVLAEAMAVGVPVVASDIDGYRDLVTPESGILVAPGDSGALAGALERMLGDDDMRARLAAGARRRALDFAWPRIAGQLLDLYGDAIERSRHVTASR